MKLISIQLTEKQWEDVQHALWQRATFLRERAVNGPAAYHDDRKAYADRVQGAADDVLLQRLQAD